jgi:hypothetical protein
MPRRRGRHADDDGVRLGEPRKVGRGLEPACGDEGLDARRRHVLDVARAVVELLDLHAVDVEADHTKADLAEAQHQRQAHVPEADDPDGIGRPPGRRRIITGGPRRALAR